jgi:hypothetical protein
LPVVDDLDVRIGQELLVAAIGLGNTERLCGGARLGRITRGEANELSQRPALHAGQADLLRKIAGAEDAPADGCERFI